MSTGTRRTATAIVRPAASPTKVLNDLPAALMVLYDLED
jgi:hypothetical protein